MSLRTGQKVVTKLRKYINGYPTSEVKTNDSSDSDYIAPAEDLKSCQKYTVELVAAPTPAPAPVPVGTPVAPVAPTPVSYVPTPVGVTEEVPPDPSTVCDPCYTREEAERQCKTYEVESLERDTTRDIVVGAAFQYTNCENGEIIEVELRPEEVINITSLTLPKKVYGYDVAITEGEESGDFVDIDINQYHYLASGCYDQTDRVLRSVRQFNVGDVVKTANSTCCWEIISIVSPRAANNIVYSSASDKFDSCSDCCDTSAPDSTYGQEATNDAEIPNAPIQLTSATSVKVTNKVVFEVAKSGLVDIEMRVDLTTGNYARGAGRVLKGDGVTRKTVVEFPLDSRVLPYVENRPVRFGGTGDPVSQLKQVYMEAGVYQIVIDPPEASSNAFGAVNIIVNPT
jgi:hypothetical protein